MFFDFFKKMCSKTTVQKAGDTEVKGEEVGHVTHYFSHNKACVIKLQVPLKIGDKIHIKGHTTDFEQTITSMQINGKPITSANKGDEVGLLVKERARSADTIYKID